MEAFVSSYGLPFDSFQQQITTTNALIAGSSALSFYLKQEGIETTFKPTDMDIFMGKSDTHKDTLLQFITRHGYKEIPDATSSDYTNINDIIEIIWLENASKHNIQIIHINTECILEYIAEQFDISCCITWWNSATNTFATLYPAYTRKMKMFISNTKLYEDYCSGIIAYYKRITKYVFRDFVLFPPPITPSILERKDRRYPLFSSDNPFQQMTAFDIWSYEDVNCHEFLLDSSFNILVKVGEQFYAFDRSNLHKYMSTQHTYIPSYDYVYRTPHNQSISYNGLTSILYSDYSIFELHSASTISVDAPRRVEVSLFHIHCYSVKDWIQKTPTRIILSNPNHMGEDNIFVADEYVDDEDDFGPPAGYNNGNNVINAENNVINVGNNEINVGNNDNADNNDNNDNADNVNNDNYDNDGNYNNNNIEWVDAIEDDNDFNYMAWIDAIELEYTHLNQQ